MSWTWTSEEGRRALQKAIELREDGLSYNQVATIINSSFDARVTGEAVRRALHRHGHLLEPSLNPEEDDEEAIRRMIEDAKEKAREERDKKLVSQLLRERGRTELILETFRNCIEAFPKVKLQPPKPVALRKDPEEALLLFSDAQIGEKITLEETNGLGAYNIDIFQHRMRHLTNEVRRIAREQSLAHPIRKLNIAMLGDNVDGINVYRGQVHHLDVMIVDQFLIGTWEIAKSLVALLDTFDEIEIWGIVGNHGRIGKKGENPSHINWDYIMYKIMKRLLDENYGDRIKWNIPVSNWTLAEINGHNFLFLHGDTIKGWNGLPYYGIDRADSRLTKMLAAHGRFFRYLCLGHHHNPAEIDSPGGEKILNGTMVGGSEFSINQLHTSSLPSQWFFGVSQEQGITWRHKILLNVFPDAREESA
ncbi:hypothetical protein [Alicyclobacillus shizuokensis]|uniref:hypothetical protein n=1 Tax=Alicyclobacillus shizuokensis TaxID=392014 RepID=UPI00082FA60A|nr:hypothetical protein [Alicyclobacillus shizuokensis]